ncbi:hypothetical protein CAPTEDRAFT_206320 [Capitella teleta]|uniref:Uncharacterized protein n=1 Tax=Capitella teleta TaxID=283909 RepID=R7VKL5_CAPTE|nr:hypothetical protein CAPTEDRAFT_206320 [Capitella teleta]|eukprot:ELU16860.1 hypothetical protein CAPTEDRAFT_206320 [Capitella teleta]
MEIIMAVIPAAWMFRSDDSVVSIVQSPRQRKKDCYANSSWPIFEVQRVLHITFSFEEANCSLDTLTTETPFEVDSEDPSKPSRKGRHKAAQRFSFAGRDRRRQTSKNEVVVSPALE